MIFGYSLDDDDSFSEKVFVNFSLVLLSNQNHVVLLRYDEKYPRRKCPLIIKLLIALCKETIFSVHKLSDRTQYTMRKMI